MLIIPVVIVALVILMPLNSTQNFNGLFSMDIPLGQHYSDVSWCKANGALGCAAEYWEDNAGCELDDNEFIVYYYDNSLLVEGESNVWQHAINDLTISYFYKIKEKDGNLVVLTNDIDMQNTPPYLVGISKDDGSEAVFVGGHNLNDLKSRAKSIEFR